MSMLELRNNLIEIKEYEDCYRILDTRGETISKWYKEDLSEDEEIKLIKAFNDIIYITDEIKLIKQLQELDNNINECKYFHIIDFFEYCNKDEIEKSEIAQEMLKLLDINKTARYLLKDSCANKIGKFLLYID